MSVIYNIDFESGDFSEFDTDTTGGAQLYVSSTDAISGTYSCNHDWKTTAGATSVSNTTNIPNPFTAFRIGFKIKIKAGFAFGSAMVAPILDWSNGSVKYSIKLAPSGGDVVAQVIFAAGGASDVFATTNLADGAIHTVEFRAIRESAPAAGDGIHAIYIDGFLENELTNVGNDTEFDDIRVSANPSGNWRVRTFINTVGDGVAGVITDDWRLRNDDTPIYPGGAADDEYTAAPMTSKPMDISADGDFLYIAALDSLGEPVLIKFSTDLNADGEIVFQPGEGADIGCEAARVDADTVYVAGDFSSTYVQKTNDAGASFTDITPSGGGAVQAFKVGPDSDDRILVFDSDNGDLLESLDAGATWTVINSSVAESIQVLARLGIDVNQAVFGASSADANTVQHSMSAGADLEPLTGGDGPAAVDVSGLIING